MEQVDLREMGMRICAKRKQLGYTQEQLAEMMDVSIQMISNLERGNKAIRIDNLLCLSRILQVSTDYILTGTQPQNLSLSEQIAALTERDQKLLHNIVEFCLNDSL